MQNKVHSFVQGWHGGRAVGQHAKAPTREESVQHHKKANDATGQDEILSGSVISGLEIVPSYKVCRYQIIVLGRRTANMERPFAYLASPQLYGTCGGIFVRVETKGPTLDRW